MRGLALHAYKREEARRAVRPRLEGLAANNDTGLGP
jgi:hypothetical protein